MSDLLSIDAGTISFLGSAGNIAPGVKKEFYMDNGELAQMINFRIQMRTAMRTGALRSDELYTVNRDPDSEDLVVFYLGETNEVDVYGRTYGRFIEGPSLGNSSPTISDPSHMYARIETDDRDLIQAWGMATLGKATDIITAMQGGF